MHDHSAEPALAYWELSDNERATLPDTVVGKDEQFVMFKINQGRRYVLEETSPETIYPGTSDLLLLPDRVEDCNYYDAIASILMAAQHAGHDVDELCELAIDQQKGFMRDARLQATRLRGDPASD